MSNIRVAYVGCGAVVQRSHLPAISNCHDFTVTGLVDFNETQRVQLADQYGVKHHSDSFAQIVSEFDVAVIATPSASHYSLARQLLEQGKHVLVEKPLAIDHSSAIKLTELAKEKNLVLAVSLVRRFLPHFKLFKALLDTKLLGDIKTFVIEEGSVFNWPVQGSGFYDHQISGGGVLMDNGAHLLDACLWWLGDYQRVTYKDDAQGGVEAECDLNITLTNGAKGRVSMSRLRQLSNKIDVVGEQGALSMNLATGKIDLQINGSPIALQGEAVQQGNQKPMTTVELFEYQYNALYKTIKNKSADEQEELVLGQTCLESIRLIDECYRNRTLLSYLVS